MSSAGSFKESNDGPIAIFILFVVLTGVVVGGLYLYKNKKLGKKRQQSVLNIPAAREEFAKGKERLDQANPVEFDELKKLLMHRAISTIPMILQLQNDGSSIDSLYKKGMLTDDMHLGVKEIKAFVDQEYLDVQNEADSLIDNWGQQIWPSAMHFYQVLVKKGQEEADKELRAEEEKKNDKKKEKREKSRKIKEEMNMLQPSTSSSSLASNASTTSTSSIPVQEEVAELSEAEKADLMAAELLKEEEVQRAQSPQGGGSAKKNSKKNK